MTAHSGRSARRCARGATTCLQVVELLRLFANRVLCVDFGALDVALLNRALHLHGVAWLSTTRRHRPGAWRCPARAFSFSSFSSRSHFTDWRTSCLLVNLRLKICSIMRPSPPPNIAATTFRNGRGAQRALTRSLRRADPAQQRSAVRRREQRARLCASSPRLVVPYRMRRARAGWDCATPRPLVLAPRAPLRRHVRSGRRSRGVRAARHVGHRYAF